MKKISKVECKNNQVNDFRTLLQRTVNNYPKNIAYKFKEKEGNNTTIKEITYEQLNNEVEALSTSLLNLGLRGKRVAIIGNNRYEWCASYLAVTTADMIVVPLDKALPDNEIELLLKRSKAEAIIFEEKYMECIKKIKQNAECKLQYLINMDENKEEGVISYKDLITKGNEKLSQGDKTYKNIGVDSEKMTIMLFTSGTTSEAKAVMLCQRNICSNIVALSEYVKVYPTDTLLSFLPLHHTFECTITFLFGMYSGSTVAFNEGLKYIQSNLKEFGITVFVAVPAVLETMYKKIEKAIEDKGKTKLIQNMIKVCNALSKVHIDIRKKVFKEVLESLGGKLRVVLYGAAPMNKQTIIGYNNLGIELIQGYGLTETSPVISAETYNRKMPGSVGLPLVNLQVKIIDPDENGVGEIVVKGPSIMLGYYENEEATKKVLTKDGWFSTGDYGYLDKQGFLYVTGRKSDVIVLSNGKNVYPQEIEFLINKIPYITESIVYARQRDSKDTSILAKIVYDADLIKESLGEKTKEEYKEEIWKQIKKMNENLPDYKHVKGITITTESLAKTTTQKVKRYQEIKKMQEA